MDSYTVKQRLGKGAQGLVFLVEDKQSGQQLVLKKVECNDEAQANKAFKEAVALQHLKHPYICGYKEFFVVWDQQDYAICVCIMMDYYKMGDLDKVLRGKREQKIPLEEMVLKKWIGQLLEALHYVHSEKMIHRDLKPSNVFLKDDMSIAIGDFGVATVMGNIRTVTRTTVGSMSWMAPEILDLSSKYDERSDIWSLGCVIVEMATCGFMDSAQVSGVLYQLKDDPNVLEDVLTHISSQYSPQLSKMIRMCLIRAFEQRPSSQDLVNLPYSQECLGLSSSKLYKGACKGGDGDMVPLPEGSGLPEVMDYLRGHGGSEKRVEVGLKTLISLSIKQDTSLGDDVKTQVLSGMRDFPSSGYIQALSCQVLENIATTVGEGDMIFGKDFVKAVLEAMRCHSESNELQRSALALITVLSTDEEAAVFLGKEGGIQDVLCLMRTLSDEPSIVTGCCTALWSLSVIDMNLEIITKEKGVVDVCKALKSHDSSAELVEAACSTLWSLSMDDTNLDIMLDYGIVDLLLKAILSFTESPGIVKFATATLSSLVQVHEKSAYQVVHSEEGVDGIPLLLKALGCHASNAEVTETLASLLHDMTEYHELKEELISYKVWDRLAEIQSTLSQSDQAKIALTDAMAALSTGSARPSSGTQKITDPTKLPSK